MQGNVMLKKLKRLASRFKYIIKLKKLRKKLYLQSKIVVIDCKYKKDLDYRLSFQYLGKIKIKNKKYYVVPAAILNINKTSEEYYKTLHKGVKHKIRRAKKYNFTAKQFDYNKYLDDVYDINTSKVIRQNQKMKSTYLEYPKKISDDKIMHWGVFFEDKLVAYMEFFLFNNFGLNNRILGHGEFLKYGTMNFLYYTFFDFALQKNIKWITYLNMLGNTSLSKFKKNAGFENYLIRCVTDE